MEYYETEEQQWEAIKRWFKRHGNRITWALIIVLSIFVAGRYWFHHQEVERERAADQYLAFLITLTDKAAKTTQEGNEVAPLFQKGDLLIKDFPESPYATLVAFALAREAVLDQQWDKADHYLRWTMQNGKSKAFKALGRVRLMRLLFSQNKGDEALKLYDENKAEGFLTEMAEIKGDILLKQADMAGAVTAYKKAYLSAPEGAVGPLLKMKMENVGIDLNTLKRETEVNKKEEKHD